MSRLGCSSLLLLAWMSQADNCGDWSSWSTCSQTCGLGVQTQTYSATNTGTGCQWADGQSQTQPCQVQSCLSQPPGVFTSISSVVSDAWCQKVCKPDSTGLYPSACVASTTYPAAQVCSQAQQAALTSTGGILQPSQILNSSSTLVADCVGTWGQWGPCTSGNQTRTYYIATPASPTGQRCPYSHLSTQTDSCTTNNTSGASTKACYSIQPQVTDWWCLQNCIPDSKGNFPAACAPNAVTPQFQVCSCNPASSQTGCWSTSPSVPDSWCSLTCTTMDANGDLAAACTPGAFQTCKCRFLPLPASYLPPASSTPSVSPAGPPVVSVTAAPLIPLQPASP